MGFVSTVEAQPWYAGVANTMQAAGVPQDVWLAEMQVESQKDATGAPIPNASWADNGGVSYGLFSLRQPGVGSGYSVSTLESPTGNASIAAAAMHNLLAAAGNPSGAAAIQALSADWPGAWDPASADSQARLSALQSVDQQLGGATPNPNETLQQAWGLNSLGIPNSIANVVNPFAGLEAWISSTWASFWKSHNVVLLGGAIIVALIAYAMIRSDSDSDGSSRTVVLGGGGKGTNVAEEAAEGAAG